MNVPLHPSSQWQARRRIGRRLAAPGLRLLPLLSLVLLPCAAAGAQGAAKSADESLVIGDIPSVFGASRFDQAVTEAPASVSVVTADDIRSHGWRTLGDLLRTVRGFYVTNDRTYTYVGTRGFGRPGDYNARILLLIDGNRINENIFDAAYVGLESMVDLSAVDRVEVIRGPASSLYGANAFFAIINVITRRGRASSGVRAAADVGSFGSREFSVDGGVRTRRGLEFFGAVGSRRVTGQDHYFQEFDSVGGGVATGRDGEQRDRLFGKLEWGAFSLEAIANVREKVVPTASYETQFNEGRLSFRDQAHHLTLRYQQAPVNGSSVSGSVSLNRYDYEAKYPYPGATLDEWSHGRWAIAEAQYSRRIGAQHRVLLGGAVTRNMRQEQGVSYDRTLAPDFSNDTTSNAEGAFAVAEVHLTDRLIFNGGLRFDHSRWLSGNWTPRAALIYRIGEGSALKLLHGNAYRAPTNFERYYNDGNRTQKANVGLVPERISTTEVLLEKVLSPRLKWTSSVYRYQANRLIELAPDALDSLLQYNNSGAVRGEGIEMELELELGRVSGRASYTLQRAESAIDDAVLSNSPRHLGVATLWMPLASSRARLGLELRGMSSRLSPRNDVVAGHAVVNVVLSSARRLRGVDVSLGAFNLFDSAYNDPVGEEHLQRAILQDGRTVRLSVGYAF